MAPKLPDGIVFLKGERLVGKYGNEWFVTNKRLFRKVEDELSIIWFNLYDKRKALA